MNISIEGNIDAELIFINKKINKNTKPTQLAHMQ